MSRTDGSSIPVQRPRELSVARSASPARCLVVWVGVTLLSLIATLLGLGAATDAIAMSRVSPPSFDQVLPGLAGAAAALVCPWLWLISSLTVAEALSGRVRPPTGWVRRLTLAACGCAVTLTAVAPAHAGDAGASTEAHEVASSISVLNGLPFPERPSSRIARDDQSGPEAVTLSPKSVGVHVVERGDTLWSIAAGSLHASGRSRPPTSAQTARAVTILHEHNRDVLGDNPDLIQPGQRLDMTLGGGQER